MNKLETAEKLISMWENEGRYEGVTEWTYYNDTLISMGYNETDRDDIIGEIDLEEYDEVSN